jgi:hypothetical protein
VHLRTPTPTLEPDDAFVARLSALAAAGAPVERHSPLTTWRVALAAAGVAAILVGVAWLTGLSPSGSPQPAPGPATTPSAPESADASATGPASSSTSQGTPAQPGFEPGFGPGSAPIGADPTAMHSTTPPVRVQDAPANQQDQQDQGQPSQPSPQGQGQQGSGKQAGSRGPDGHAGDHPDGHAIIKSNQGQPPDDDKQRRGPGSRGGNADR